VTSLRKYLFLHHLLPPGRGLDYGIGLASYFKKLLGEHYVD